MSCFFMGRHIHLSALVKNRAFAQLCRVCRKSRPLEDFRSTSSYKINKTCRECLDARKAGKAPDVAPAGLSIYLPVVVPVEARSQRRWWPSWVHAEDPTVRLNPVGAGDTRTCDQCGREYEVRDRQQRFCCRRCKSAWHRNAAKTA